MTKPESFKSFRYRRDAPRRTRSSLILLLMAVVLSAGWYYYGTSRGAGIIPPGLGTNNPPRDQADRGRVLSVESAQHYTATEAATVVHQNYGAASPLVQSGLTKVIFRYRSYDPDGTPLVIYGRAYVPDAPRGKLPVWAFSSGTTGIGDQCAGSLEQPQVINWANYDSHMMAYATQGYASVITDYEGMRDPGRIHHYMVGELEGRAVLDGIRALRRLSQAAGRVDVANVFLGGYSQGGHAAYWADKIQPSYASDLTVRGVVGFGPVMNVKGTLTDVTRAANINWFGPYVLTSYADYYRHDYNLEHVLLPSRREHLRTEVLAHCIDTVLQFWGHTPDGVYTPEFIQAMTSNNWDDYPNLSRDLDRNAIGDQATTSAKRINEGQFDNVVLPRQQEAIVPTLCLQSRGPVQYVVYPNSTHYNTMVHSFADTLGWMKQLREGQALASTCH